MAKDDEAPGRDPELTAPATRGPNDVYARARAWLIERGLSEAEADDFLSCFEPVEASDEAETEGVFYSKARSS